MQHYNKNKINYLNKKQVKVKMFVDIVFPKNNEKKFIEMAEKLNIQGICFAYDFKNKKDFIENKEKVNKLKEKTKINLFTGIVAEQKDLSKAKQITKFVICKSPEDNRHVFEKGRPSVIFELEKTAKKDSMHSRNSGLNHILCGIANKKRILVGFSFSSVLDSEDMLRTQIIGRMMQNIRLCRKYNVKKVIASFADDPYKMRAFHDLKSVFISFGMHPKEAKDSLEMIYKLYKNS